MTRRTTGSYERAIVGGEEVAAFIPLPLPPVDPPLSLSTALAHRLQAAEQALIRLEFAGEMVFSLDAFVRKEAVVSSQIEGTQATLVDLLAFEAQGDADGKDDRPAPPTADVEEICSSSPVCSWNRPARSGIVPSPTAPISRA